MPPGKDYAVLEGNSNMLALYPAGNIQDPTMTDEAIQSHYGHRSVMATVVRGGETKEYKLKDLAPAEKLEKFVEDVRFGIYPITNFGLLYRWELCTQGLSPTVTLLEPNKSDILSECRFI